MVGGVGDLWLENDVFGGALFGRLMFSYLRVELVDELEEIVVFLLRF